MTLIDQQKQEYVSDGVEYVPSLQRVYSPVFTDPRLLTSASSSVPIAGIMVGLGSLAGAGRQMVSLLEQSGADTLDLVIITSGDSVARVARFIGDIIAKQVTQRVVCQDGYSSYHWCYGMSNKSNNSVNIVNKHHLIPLILMIWI